VGVKVYYWLQILSSAAFRSDFFDKIHFLPDNSWTISYRIAKGWQ
jgi:hypothetical protein